MDEEKKARLRREEETEKLAVLGQRSDFKALPWVREEADRVEKLSQTDLENDLTILQELTKGQLKYYFKYLAGIFMKFCQEESIPKTYQINLSLSDLGILVKIKGTKYQGAFKPSGFPVFDRHACKILAVKLGNTIAKLEGYVPTTEHGIALVDEEDLKKYATNS